MENTRKPASKPEVKAAHLPQVDSIAVAVEDCEACVGSALDEHAGDPVAARRAGVEHLQVLLLAVAVLPLGLVGEVQLLLVPRLIFILSSKRHWQLFRMAK